MTIRETLHDIFFCHRHRRCAKDFTRKRDLGFVMVVLIQLRLMLSSLQRDPGELSEDISPGQAVATASALSQARAKLKHTAFVELNELCLREFYQKCPRVRLWRGLVLTAADGSTVALPRRKVLAEAFGGMKPNKGDFRPKARVSGRYDVPSHMTLQAIIAPYKQGERTLLREHLNWDLKEITGVDSRKVLTLYDRGFAAFHLLQHHFQTGTPFVLRLPSRWWKVAKAFVESGKREETFTLEVRGQSFPLRLIRVDGEGGGEPAVLATNLLDRNSYPAECFGKLYEARWGVESGFKLLKCRAELEKWSAKSEEGIRQDFYAKVMTLNMTSALGAETADEIDRSSAKRKQAGKAKHKQQINRTHALGAVRRHLPKMLWGALNMIGSLLGILNACFRRRSGQVREDRSNPRPSHPKRMPPTAYKPL